MARLLTRTFKSLKPHSNSRSTLLPFANPTEKSRNPSQILPPSSSINPSSSESPSVSGSSSRNSWAVYVILSTNPPIKTYVGVTNNFSRRLKQHNGEVKGGAKASRAGKPWICACLIKGFQDKSKAYEFESKWKSFSRKLPRKRSSKNMENADSPQILLLQHRYASLNQVKDVIDCSHLEIDWRLDPILLLAVYVVTSQLDKVKTEVGAILVQRKSDDQMNIIIVCIKPVAANEKMVGGAVKSYWTRTSLPSSRCCT